MDYFDRGDVGVLDGIADGMVGNLPSRKAGARVIITIPAHNEEKYIAGCVASIARQRTVGGLQLDRQDFEILVLCHNCTDLTYRIAVETLSSFPDLNFQVLQTNRPEVNNVGAVRRVLMRIAYGRMDLRSGYIAMTDADTVADPHWLANIIGYVGSGYGLICGRIDIDTGNISKAAKNNLTLRLRYDSLWLSLKYSIVPDPFDPMPRHNSNSGPNMAVRADVYDSIGGMDPLGFCEDIFFHDKVVWSGYRTRHCPSTIVTTSGRTDARAPWGFGAELGTWDGNNGADPQVEGLEPLLERLRIYKSVCGYSENKEEFTLLSAVRRSGIKKETLLGYIDEFANHNALILKLEKVLDVSENWRQRYPKMAIGPACSQLENYLSLASGTFSRTSDR